MQQPRLAPAEVDAYGLRLRVASSAAPTERTVDLVLRPWSGALPAVMSDGDRTIYHLVGGGWADIDRRARTATFHTNVELTTEDLLHPYAALPGVEFAAWRGEVPIHAAAVIVAGRAWGLLGDQQHGKSTMALACWLAGHPVLTDDVLVLSPQGEHDEVARPGPPFIDLREPTARRFADALDMTLVRGRKRWRVATGGPRAAVPFGGWVILAEGSTVGVERVRAADALRLLLTHRSTQEDEPDPRTWLRLATRPVRILRRPKDWAHVDEAIERLVTELS